MITPPYAHINIESLFNVGPIFDKTVGFVGIHVPAGTGIHGHGAPTIFNGINIGFDGVLQNKNGTIFKNGIPSGMHPIGPADPIIIDNGKKVRGVGAVPKVQVAIAPVHKPKPISTPYRYF